MSYAFCIQSGIRQKTEKNDRKTEQKTTEKKNDRTHLKARPKNERTPESKTEQTHLRAKKKKKKTTEKRLETRKATKKTLQRHENTNKGTGKKKRKTTPKPPKKNDRKHQKRPKTTTKPRRNNTEKKAENDQKRPQKTTEKRPKTQKKKHQKRPKTTEKRLESHRKRPQNHDGNHEKKTEKKPCWLESGCRSGLGRVPPDSTPLRETQSPSLALSAVSGVSSQRGREAWGYLPTLEVTIIEGKLKLLGSNFSEKPPVRIGGCGPNGMAGGSKGTGQGWLGVTGILDCNAEFNGTVGGQSPAHLQSPGEEWPSPAEGSTKRWRQRQWEWEGRGAQGGKPPTLLREGYTYHGGDSMHRLPNLQLDNPKCMQILRLEIAPGALHCENGTTVPGTGAQQPGCTLLLCGILRLVLRQCCQRIPRPGRRKRKGQGPHDSEGGEPGPHSGKSPRVRPSQRGVPEPARPTAQRSQRSAPTRSQARFSNCETEKSRGESAEMQGSPEAGRGGFAFCPRRKGGDRLRVESRPGTGKRPRVGPYGAPTYPPREKVTLANPAL